MVFEVVSGPCLKRTPRAVGEKLNIRERGSDLVLAARFTPIAGGRLTAVAVETVRLTPPERIDFRLARPVVECAGGRTVGEHRGRVPVGDQGRSGTPGPGRAPVKKRSASAPSRRQPPPPPDRPLGPA
nr:hypothetical protein [Streptomyces smyrnaeus]